LAGNTRMRREGLSVLTEHGMPSNRSGPVCGPVRNRRERGGQRRWRCGV